MNAIILAGGRGRRMGGIDKSSLRLGGETFIERILRVLEPFHESILIVTNDPDRFTGIQARRVRDQSEGRGPLMGLYSGLKESSTELNFVTAVDVPLLCPALVRYLCARAEDPGGPEADVVVPCSERGIEPLCAVYARRCIPSIEAVLDQGRIVSFFPLVRVRQVPASTVSEIDPGGLSFLNVNTPEDFAAVEDAFRRREP
jgi:molybdopterin-guanine dinucleotide biosynthesis protein A